MHELSLFSGAGGGLLGSKLLGWRTIGYVERESYCQKVIVQRITDGFLDAAPVFGDIRRFIADGYAAAYSGLVDVVSAGFPCQPFSVAGKRQGGNDERNMWPSTKEVIRIVKPRYAYLENVPGLLGQPDSNSGEWSLDNEPKNNVRYFGTILSDLSKIGYHARWTVMGADDVGAPHRRKRLWVLAYANGHG